MRYQTAPRPVAPADLSRGSVRASCEHAFVMTDRVLDYLRGHWCAECGEADDDLLEFDDAAGAVVRFDLGVPLPGSMWPSTVEEALNREVVCPNCRRRRAARRDPNVRAIAAHLGLQL